MPAIIDGSVGSQFPTTIGVGNATPSTSGAGITFPATQSASTDANTLDDYEEGTWTPSVGGSATYTIQVGTYVKIGKLVIAHFDMQINSIGSGSATTISGLPFTAGGSNQGNPASIGYWTSLATNIYSLMLRVDSASTSIVNQIQNTFSGTPTAGAGIYGNSARVTGAAIYQTA